MFAGFFQLNQRIGMSHSRPTDQPNYCHRITLGDHYHARMDETQRQVFHRMNQTHVQGVVNHFESDPNAISQLNGWSTQLLSNIRVKPFEDSN